MGLSLMLLAAQNRKDEAGFLARSTLKYIRDSLTSRTPLLRPQLYGETVGSAINAHGRDTPAHRRVVAELMCGASVVLRVL